MKLANVEGRLVIRLSEGDVDVESASAGRFASDPSAVLDRWTEFHAWAVGLDAASVEITAPASRAVLETPVTRPTQVFAIGLNYREHAAEAGHAVPEQPPTFTKFTSSLTGPEGDIELPDGDVDWEVELVVVIGRTARDVSAEDAWSHVAALTVGQDLSERVAQLAGPVPQFSLAKSHPGFGPMGPLLVTPDEFADPDDLELGCAINGETVQKSRTSDLVFSVPELISRLSATATLYPGDVIFTGTPSGVGQGRSPQRYLQPGDVLVSWVEGIGELRHRFVGTSA
ncbi:fumarylacetoacetate hydrolase family protein [Aeromicrobium sp. CTD01-1L150]|uniref:fumarylacetoacetate hydrolase family protein n=1 Tax=Aeromicrobium sp. CTD01-1L150 TaxID=3341830 RepID=UPI0035C028B7